MSTTTPATFACPGCRAALAAGTARCPHCSIRLTGELATQLWRVDQQIAALHSQREWLVNALRRDDSDDILPGQPRRAASGTETRRLLLGLGALCLIAALTAATALIWPALGVGGQTTVLLIVTGLLLAGAVRLQQRLPATAEAVAAVGVAASAIDLIAGRRLVAPDLSGAASHSYWLLGSLLVCAVLAFVSSCARRLHSPTVGAVVASYGAVVALVSPASADDVALVGLIGAALSTAIRKGAQRLPLMRDSARVTALVGQTAFAAVGGGVALVTADGRGVGLGCGLALSLGVACVGRARAFGAVGGLLAAALLVRSDIVPLGAWAVVTAGVSAAVLVTAVVVRTSSRPAETAARFAAAAALIVQLAAQRSLQFDAILGRQLTDAATGLGVVAVLCIIAATLALRSDAAALAAVGATCATTGAVAELFAGRGLDAPAHATALSMSVVFVVAAAALFAGRRARGLAIAAATSATAGAIAAVAIDASIALRDVSTIEVYVIAPGIVTAVLGVVAMRLLPSVSSWALLPALVVTTSPTLLLALDGDLTRQVVLLAIAALLVMAGAQGRLACPLAAGAAEVVLIVGRIVGPDIRQLPRWLTLGVLGAALIGLGSTWERRLQDVRRLTDRLRPTVAALR